MLACWMITTSDVVISISQYLGVQLSIGMDDCGENVEGTFELVFHRTAAEGKTEGVSGPLLLR